MRRSKGPKISGLSAVILAGGMARRMQGRDKARLMVLGVPAIKRIILVLKDIFPEIIIVTNEVRSYSYKGVALARDKIKGIGPLGGIHAGLLRIKNDAGFFVACDMPFLDSGIILKQVEFFKNKKCSALVPRSGRRIEPLHAIYKKSLAEDILNFTRQSQDYSLRGFLKTVDAGYWDMEYDNVFKNINTPEDLERTNL